MTSAISRFGQFGFLAMILLLQAGCARFQRDTAVGHWEGQWFYKGAKGAPIAGGALMCDVTRVSPEEWLAIFTAQWGAKPGKDPEQGKFSVELRGHRGETGAIVFGGDVDLGPASGGVFNWTGEIKDEIFTGVYTSKFVNGTFELMKVSAEPVAESAGSGAPAE